MTELAEDRVYARYPRRAGAVLIIGSGAVGGFLADELARAGCDPLLLIDPDVLEVENLIRHPLGATEIGRPKATALAERIRHDFPPCHATGLDANFLMLPNAEQMRLVGAADVVVAATDSPHCQLRVNEVAVATNTPAVYPAVWLDPRVRDAEVGEILWVPSDRRGPCYACAFPFRRWAPETHGARGARVDIQLIALCAAQVVLALLGGIDGRATILTPDRTVLYVHGLTPASRSIRPLFPTGGLSSASARVRLSESPCRVCGQRGEAVQRGSSGGLWRNHRVTIGVLVGVALLVLALVLAAWR
ncbi:hypothetical protein HFP15_05545 [Amycolatopsis sp. K13G38]|uniref:THIF-type NAD/FAD binding fold domain-containing protein n=1 Tax=Amycolatopsis acididurans TaxID=2724524 RepID=A0ABX1J1W1_9PSEU|nr:ThiF family adenylyltransferase [Amycolatopsis acididurans]NKQ52340.1 hypothetical protein [Amycolatopsis acididurans]